MVICWVFLIMSTNPLEASLECSGPFPLFLASLHRIDGKAGVTKRYCHRTSVHSLYLLPCYFGSKSSCSRTSVLSLMFCLLTLAQSHSITEDPFLPFICFPIISRQSHDLAGFFEQSLSLPESTIVVRFRDHTLFAWQIPFARSRIASGAGFVPPFAFHVLVFSLKTISEP